MKQYNKHDYSNKVDIGFFLFIIIIHTTFLKEKIFTLNIHKNWKRSTTKSIILEKEVWIEYKIVTLGKPVYIHNF